MKNVWFLISVAILILAAVLLVQRKETPSQTSRKPASVEPAADSTKTHAVNALPSGPVDLGAAATVDKVSVPANADSESRVAAGVLPSRRRTDFDSSTHSSPAVDVEAERCIEVLKDTFKEAETLYVFARDEFEHPKEMLNHEDEYWFKKPFSISMKGRGENTEYLYVTDGVMERVVTKTPGTPETNRMSPYGKTDHRYDFFFLFVFEPVQWKMDTADPSSEDGRIVLRSRNTILEVESDGRTYRKITRLDSMGNPLYIIDCIVYGEFPVGVKEGGGEDVLHIRFPKTLRETSYFRGNVVSVKKTTIEKVSFNDVPPEDAFDFPKVADSEATINIANTLNLEVDP